MASPNMCLIRLKQALLEPKTEYVVRRDFIPVDKNNVRLRVSVHPAYVLDGRGTVINPARRMSEADRRALGLRRNGQPRRARRPRPETPDRKITAA